MDFFKEFSSSPEFKIVFSAFLGLIIGLEREIRAKFGHDIFAGIRTFPLIAVLGTLSGLLHKEFPYVFLSFLGIVILASISYLKDKRMGITTEVSAIITFVIGLLISAGEYYLAVVTTILTTFILVLRDSMENLAKRLDEEDVITVLKFFTVSFVVLPLLPDKEIIRGLNPSEVWKFVILVSSVDFVGYFLLRYKGTGSLIITALIGGIPSSTAVTMAFSSLSQKLPHLSELFFFSVILSWIVMFLRVIFYTFLVFKGMIYKLIFLLFPYFALLLLFALLLYLRGVKNHRESESVSIKNPFSLSQAFTFGLIYSAISIVSYHLKAQFGNEGIYILSFISGVMDIDAITLLLARLSDKGEIGINVASMGILLAVMSNNLFKSGYAVIFGSKKIKLYFSLVAICTLFYTIILLTLFDKLHISS